MNFRRVLILCVVMVFAITAVSAEGQKEVSGAGDFPSETVTIVNPWSAGGGSDVMTRMIAPYLEEELDTPVVVINKPGSGGEVGFVYIQNAKTDGYTIGLTNTPNFLSFPLMREVEYDWQEFIPLINIVTDPGIIAVLADDERFQTLEEFVDYAAEHDAEVTLGNSGIGGDDYIAALLFQDQAGVEFNHVAFGGAGPNRTSLLGGHIDAAAFNASEAVQYVDSGQLTVLAVMAEERYPDLPDVPTFEELGYNVISGSSRGISAPPGTPEERVEILRDAFERAAENPEFLEQAEQAQLPLDIRIGEDYRELRDKVAADLKALYEKYPW